MLLPAVLSIFALAFLAPTLHRVLGRFAGPVFALLPAGWFAYFCGFIGAPGASVPEGSLAGTMAQEVFSWVPALNIELALRLDGLSLLMALLITGIGACIVVYGGNYLHGHRHHGRFFGYLLAFMASMLGVVLSDDIMSLFIFWELTSITSYLLIGFDHHKEDSRRSALQALLVTGLGGMALLAGLLLLGLEGGTWRLSELIADPTGIQESTLYTPALCLILLGCFTKSAIFPFHFWLPGAMAAPTPVSAYLHSSTMVKAGVFLLARLQPAMGGTPQWEWALIGFGGFTMLAAIFLASRQTIFKRLLAYSTVSSLATMVMLIGMGEAGAHAAVAYLFCHALFKGALFMLAGIADHETGVKDVEQLGGLRKYMPISAGASLLAAISMAGAPPMVGFAAKELMIYASFDSPIMPAVVVAATVLGGVLMVMVAWTVGIRPYFGTKAWDEETNPLPKKPHEAPASLLAGPVLLGTLGVVAAFMPGLFGDPIVNAARDAVAPPAAIYSPQSSIEPAIVLVADAPAGDASLAGDHAGDRGGGYGDSKKSGKGLGVVYYLTHPSIVLALSLLAVVLGTGLYFVRDKWRSITAPLMYAAEPIGPQANYSRIMKGVTTTAAWQTKLLQNGSLSSYVRTILLAAIGLGVAGIIRTGRDFFTLPEETAPVGVFETVLALLSMCGAIAATRMKSRLAAVVSMGITGLLLAVVFLIYGQPDVAMTQFAVETLTAVILVLVVWHLPAFSKYTTSVRRFWDYVVAIAFGAMMTAFTLIAVDEQFAAPISQYFAQESYTGGKGKNIVNVILVDFRGFDTLGEIVVLGMAAIGVYTLLALRCTRADTVTKTRPFFERRNEGEFL